MTDKGLKTSMLLASLTGDDNLDALSNDGSADIRVTKGERESVLLFGDAEDEATNTAADEDEVESDLFGTIPTHASTSKSRMLEGSGLLGSAAASVVPVGRIEAEAEGGLFDELDAAEEEEEARPEATAEAARSIQRSGRNAFDAQHLHEHHQRLPSDFYRPSPSLPLDHDPLSAPPDCSKERHQAQQLQPSQGYGAASYYYSTSGNGLQVQSPAHSSSSSHHQLHQNASPQLRSGMHNSSGPAPSSRVINRTTKTRMPSYSSDFKPLYGPITASDPLLVQGSGLFSGPPHWTYALVVRAANPVRGTEYATVSQVRRRFRHFVALEDRLREELPGTILPPRPDKHPTRVIEEASSRQSAQFALQRAAELEVYVNALRLHPLAGKSHVLQLFLTLPDHIGTAWPEVSSSILTRIHEVATSNAVKVAEGTSSVISELNPDSNAAAGEDNAELLALASSEGLRIGSVLQAVPKIEGAIALLKEHGDRTGVVGLEFSKLVKNVLQDSDEKEMSVPLDILSSALLRSGRRTKRLALELNAALTPFVLQYKTCKYERLAFGDRRAALGQRRDARLKADARAHKLILHQRSLQSTGKIGLLEKMEMEAALSDENAVDAVREAEEIGIVLQNEVARVAVEREREWSVSLRVLAANMKEACGEKVAIWEGAREVFMKEFPELFAGSVMDGHQQNGGSNRQGDAVSVEGGPRQMQVS